MTNTFKTRLLIGLVAGIPAAVSVATTLGVVLTPTKGENEVEADVWLNTLAQKEVIMASSYKTYGVDDITVKYNGEKVNVLSIDSTNEVNQENNEEKFRRAIVYLLLNGEEATEGIPLAYNSKELKLLIEDAEAEGAKVTYFINEANSTQKIIIDGSETSLNGKLVFDKNGYLLEYSSDSNEYVHTYTIEYNCEPHEVDTINMRLDDPNYLVNQHMYANKLYTYTFTIEDDGSSAQEPRQINTIDLDDGTEANNLIDMDEPKIYINNTEQTDWTFQDHKFTHNGGTSVGAIGDKIKVSFKVGQKLDYCEIKAYGNVE